MIDIIGFGENVAVVSAKIYEDKEVYESIHGQLANQLGGRTGIWGLCASAGKTFTEEASLYAAGEGFDWIEAIEDFAYKVRGYLETGEVPTISDMHRLAAGAIESNFIK